MHVEIRCQFFGAGGGTEGQGSWPFQMEKSVLEILTAGSYGFQGPVASAAKAPGVECYRLRKGGALLLSVALQRPAKHEHEVLQRVIGLLGTDKNNNHDWELHAHVEDDSHIDALMGLSPEDLGVFLAENLGEDLVGAPGRFELSGREIEDLLKVLGGSNSVD